MKVTEYKRQLGKYKIYEIDISKQLLWKQINIMIPFLLELTGVYVIKIDKHITPQNDHHTFIITFTYELYVSVC